MSHLLESCKDCDELRRQRDAADRQIEALLQQLGECIGKRTPAFVAATECAEAAEAFCMARSAMLLITLTGDVDVEAINILTAAVTSARLAMVNLVAKWRQAI